METLLTAEEYGDLPDAGYPTELVRGRIVRLDVPCFNHGKSCGRISATFATSTIMTSAMC